MCMRNVLAPPPLSLPTSLITIQYHTADEAEMAAYVEISYHESLEKLKRGELTHAAHAMVYAPWPGGLFDKYEHKYAVMVRH